MLCRKSLKLKVTKDELMNYNYQYALLSEIYKLTYKLDKQQSKFLHDEGYSDTGKSLKNFMVFMQFYDCDYVKEGIIINPNSNIHLVISGDKKIVEFILKSIICNGQILVNNIIFDLDNIEKEKKPKLFKNTFYKALSPIISTKWDKKVIYLDWKDKEYFEVVKSNLRRKYKQIYNKEYEGDLILDVSCIDNIFDVKQKRINNIKNKGYMIGYAKFNFWLIADRQMQEIAYYLGLGKGNTLGAGFLEQLGYREEE